MQSVTEHTKAKAEWMRVSSWKPFGILLGSLCLTTAMLGWILKGASSPTRWVALSGMIAFLLLAASRVKIIYKKENEYKLATLFWSETISPHDICMIVSKRGVFWTSMRIHVTKPTRLGWVVSFVPIAPLALNRSR
ncbi:MAG: hypothetical protein ACO1QB_10110 [Verrucomicrobiales bacterium]